MTQTSKGQRQIFPLRNSLGGRILAGFMAMAFISLVVALASIIYTAQAGNNLDSQITLDQRVTNEVLRLELAVEREFNAVRGYLLLALPEDLTTQELNSAAADYELGAKRLDTIFDSLNINRSSFDEVQRLYTKYRQTINDIQAIDLADFIKSAIRVYENDARTQKTNLIHAIDNVLQVYRQEIGKSIEGARSQGVIITVLALALVMLATIGGIVVASLITRSITKPLRELATVAESIRQDDLSVVVPQSRGKDEVATLASAMSGMLHNLRISREELEGSLKETQQRNRELTVMNRVIALLSGTLDLHQIWDYAMDELILFSEMEYSSLFLMDPTGQFLRLVTHRNQSPDYVRHFSKGVKIGEQMTGTVAKTGEVIFTNKVNDDPRMSDEIRNRIGIVTYLGIPLTSSGRVVGVISLSSSRNLNISESDLKLYKNIGSQVGIAVENAQLYSQAQMVAALEERNRLARDLHDSVTQTLFSITLTAESARAMLVKKPEKVEQQLDRLQNLARGALAEMRSLIFQLRPEALEEQGLSLALQKHIDSLTTKDNNLSIIFEVEGDKRLSNEQEQTLYRIAQESLNNVVKHSGATKVKMKLAISDLMATLIIHDNGVGFNSGELNSLRSGERKSFGMTSMRERAELAGGSFDISSKPGEGTIITVSLPLLVAPRPVGVGIN